MRLFSRSLKEEALEWFISKEIKQWPSWNVLVNDFLEWFGYNIEIIRDQYYLGRLKQNCSESYREYAYRWRRETEGLGLP